MRILLVDDSVVTRKLVSALLEKAGHEVRTAVDAKEALATLPEFRADCILMDFLIPGMSGTALTKRLKSNPATGGTVIIALTACTLNSDIVRAIEAGCDAFIAKPIDSRNFASQVQAYFDEARPAT
jgi:CheY-like chemotaxis protein